MFQPLLSRYTGLSQNPSQQIHGDIALTQIRKRFLHGGSLAHRAHLRAFSDENAVFLMNHCCKHVSSISQAALAVTAYRAENACNFCNFKKCHSFNTSRNSFSHAFRVGAVAQTPSAPRILPKYVLLRSIRSYLAFLAIKWSTYRVDIASVHYFSHSHG